MGEVYRARDTRLKRDVALKVLPSAFAQDPDRVARFQREAELLATVNHPNIAAVHGLEQADGLTAIVLELVEGETLADVIARGPIEVGEAISIARQIAAALDGAHEKGVIHRDLKPANVAFTDDGTVKVLDFGLAKALDTAPTTGRTSQSPTMTSPAMTDMGIILGTAAYMSPEQAKGRPADKRSDVWAFGCVLFEMLSGRRPFDAESVSEVLAAVLMKEPDWTLLPAATPPSVVSILHSCLHKDRKQRVRDIGDVSLALQGAFETVVPLAPDRAAPPSPMGWRRALAASAALLAAGAAGAAAVWLALRPAPPGIVRTEITAGGGRALLVNGFNRDVAITPDGSRIVYRGQSQLLVRALDRLEPVVLSGLGTPRGVFVSPDGRWVGFFDGNTVLKKVGIAGGPASTLCTVDGNGSRGATWGPDGTIIYATYAPTGLQRVSSAGGTPTLLTTPDPARGEGDHVWPEFLPGGRAVLFTIIPATGGIDDAQIAVLDLQSRHYKVLLRGGSHAHYVPTGHLVYGAAGTVRAVAFNLARLEVVGTPVVVLDQVVTTSAGALDMVIADNGTIVYVPGGIAGAAGSLVWVDRAGREEPLSAPVRTYSYPRLSPDGTRVAVDTRDQGRDIWIWDLPRHTMTQLTFDPADDLFPTWTPDSQRIIYASARSGVTNLFWQAADGTGTAERLSESANMQRTSAVTADGTRVVLGELTPKTGMDLLLINLREPGRPQPLIATAFNERNAELAPDGRWMAYESTESGREEVYVRPFPAVEGGRWLVSAGGGRTPMWSRDGRELFYLSPGNLMMGVQVEAGASWRSSTPVQILRTQYFESGVGSPRNFDIDRNGRFLMIKLGGDNAPQSLVVVQNWLEELKRLVLTR